MLSPHRSTRRTSTNDHLRVPNHGFGTVTDFNVQALGCTRMINPYAQAIIQQAANHRLTDWTSGADHRHRGDTAESADSPYILEQCPGRGRTAIGDRNVDPPSERLTTSTDDRAQATEPDCINIPSKGYR
jgi:hypothetical protein